MNDQAANIQVFFRRIIEGRMQQGAVRFPRSFLWFVPLFISLLTACNTSVSSSPAVTSTQYGSATATSCTDLQHAPYTIRQLSFQERSLNNGWSPDSRRLAFTDPKDGRVKVYDTQTNTVVSTLTPSMHASSPEWASDGRIFFSSRPDGAGQGPSSNASHHTPPSLYVVHSDGSGLEQISLSNDFPSGSTIIYWDSTTPAKFSPDGKHVAFSTIQNVVTRNGRPVGGNWLMLLGDLVSVHGQLRLEHMRQLNHPDSYWYEAKDFTRDGTQLIFASTRGDGHGNPNVNPDVYTMNLTTGAIKRYTRNPAWEETMDITPSRQFLVFNSDRDNLSLGPSQIESSSDPQKQFLKVLSSKTAHHDLYLAGPQGDTGWVRRLTFDGNPDKGGWDSTQPRWSPDGRSLRFQQTSNGTGINRTMLLTFSCTPSVSTTP